MKNLLKYVFKECTKGDQASLKNNQSQSSLVEICD